jgi:DNA-directed RNA polymerase subunit RPC12/RpoP
MITIKCARCKRKLFKYEKIGKGRVLKCFKSRIVKYYPAYDFGNLRCECGQVIGTDQIEWIKLRPHALEYSGTLIKK